MNIMEKIRNEVYDEVTVLDPLEKLIKEGKIEELQEAVEVAEREMDIFVDRIGLMDLTKPYLSQRIFDALFYDVEIDQDLVAVIIKEFPFDLKRILPLVINHGVPIKDVVEAYFRRENFDEYNWQEDCEHSCSSEEEECPECLEDTDSYQFLSWIISKYDPRDLGEVVSDFEAKIINHIYSKEDV